MRGLKFRIAGLGGVEPRPCRRRGSHVSAMMRLRTSSAAGCNAGSVFFLQGGEILRLKDTMALITGDSSDIGRASAILAAREVARLCVVGRDAARGLGVVARRVRVSRRTHDVGLLHR